MPQRADALRAAPAAAMTRTASRQSYLTIRWLADPAYRADAFALYAYFRWLDDTVDERLVDQRERRAFVARQRTLLAQATAGAAPTDVSPEEALLVSLVRSAQASARRGEPAVGGLDGRSDGLLLCLHSMLDVMDLDARRRGSPVTQDELDDYTGRLAIAVTEALHHCIGHGRCSPHDETRYVAVAGAHITHMLRDLAEDLDAGYLNIPSEVIADRPVSFQDLHTPELRDWVRDRVALARSSFATGRRCLAQTESPRCRLAGHAYIARFEWVLDTVERDGYRLRRSYPERATWRGGLTIAADGARSALAGARPAARRTRGVPKPGPAERSANRTVG